MLLFLCWMLLYETSKNVLAILDFYDFVYLMSDFC